MLRPTSRPLILGIFASLLVTSVPLRSETVVTGRPMGVIKTELSPGNNAFSLPLLNAGVFTGTVAGNTTSTLSFATGGVSSLLESGKKYYVEVETGPLEGERFDLDNALSAGATLGVDLSPTSASTSNSIPEGVLMGARVTLREHVTLSSLKALFNPALSGHNSAARADGVQLFVNGALRSFYLRADGKTWRESGKAVDESGRVIPPDTSLILVLRSGPRSWEHLGLVRTNVFRVNLPAGARSFATGYPLDLSPAQIGAFTDMNLPASQRWVGNDNPALADTLQVFEAGAFATYYLRGNGVSWHRIDAATEVQHSTFLRAPGTVVVKRANADTGALIVPPFSL